MAAARPAGSRSSVRPTAAKGPNASRASKAPKAAKPSKPRSRAAETPAAPPRPRAATSADPRQAVLATVTALKYELVDVELAGRGLLRVTIDRLPGQRYAEPGEAVTVGDCEAVTRQLQYALEVDGIDYARLEVSSPGLDRPLRQAADFERFAGQLASVTLKVPLAGRKHFQGLLGKGEAGGFTLQFNDGKAEQVLGFEPTEVREARLVPVVDFKGRRTGTTGKAGATDDAAAAGSDRPSAANDEVTR